jgi:hypothetical protein
MFLSAKLGRLWPHYLEIDPLDGRVLGLPHNLPLFLPCEYRAPVGKPNTQLDFTENRLEKENGVTES